MKQKSIIKIENYFEIFILLSLIMIFLFIIRHFILSIFFSSIMVFFTFNIFERIKNKIKNKHFAAIFIVFMTLSLILLPIYLLSISLLNQTYDTINNGNSIIENLNLNLDSCKYSFCNRIKDNLGFIDFNIEKLINNTATIITKYYSKIFDSISYIVLNLFIFILSFYYLLIDGEKFLLFIKKIIPMKNEYKNALFIRFKDISKAIFINTILVALIQGFLLGLGFKLFSINNYIFWGLIGAIFALLPMIGTAFIWFPAFIYLLISRDLYISILFLLYSIFIVSLSDNFLRAYLLKNKIQVHPFLILISVLGGIEIFGFFGIFIGPTIISLLITIIHLYNLEFK